VAKTLKRLDLLMREVQDPHAQENFYRLKDYIDNLQTSGGTGPQGPQGPAGPTGPSGVAGTSLVITKTAGETISAGKAVYLDTATTVKFSDHSVPARQKCIGVAKTAATAGNPLDIITDGVFEDSIFSGFTINESVWVGTNGVLTQTPPTSGVLLEAGYYLGENKIEIEIKRPIILA
jgi:predicted RecA/RadA family phage recombinase